MKRAFAALSLVGLLAIACGSGARTPSPTVAPVVIGQDIVLPAIGTQNPVPATNAYPFSRWVTFPAGTQQLSVYEAPGGSTWVGSFVLPSTSIAAVEALRREAESKGLRTVSIASGSGGFSLHGEIEGLIQVQSFDATSQTIFIALTKLPQR
jgi:hypothetical protein